MISFLQNLDVFAMMGMAVIGLAGIVLIIFIYSEAGKPTNKFKLRIPPHNIEEEKNETNERTCHVQTEQPVPMTIAKLETEKGKAEKRIGALKGKLQNCQASLQESEDNLRKMVEQNERSNQKVKHQEIELQECRKEKDDLLRRLQRNDDELQMNIKENGELRRCLSEQKSQEERIQKELNQEREEKDQALKRLSAIMSSRLKDGNPNVVDLNDQNRPTKIGEKYSELYDNQWTDAYGALESNFGDNEQQIIEILRFMIEQSFSKCKDDATAQLDNFRKGIETLAGSIATKSKTLTNDMMQRLKEERKAFAIDCQPSVQSVGEAIAQSLTDHFDSLDFLKHPTLQAYLEECVRLCWFMVIQDPPMVLISNPGQNQSHLFRSYLHNGPHMKFVVWPALLLSDQGSLVMKGTAEFTGQ